MRRVQKRLKILNRPVSSIHRRIVGNVISIVAQRRWIKRQKPNRVDSEFLQVVELLRQPAKIADAVVVAVTKRPHMKLINNGIFVPELVVLRGQRLLSYSNFVFRPAKSQTGQSLRIRRA